MTSYEFEVAAKNAVLRYCAKRYRERFSISEISLVWFAHVLGNKKAILIDNAANNRIYEVTYNAGKDEMYLDVYFKMANETVREYNVSVVQKEDIKQIPTDTEILTYTAEPFD